MAVYKKEKDIYNVYENKKINLTVEKIKKIAGLFQDEAPGEEQRERESRVLDDYFCWSDQPGIWYNEGKNYVLITNNESFEIARTGSIKALLDQGVNVFTKESADYGDAKNYYPLPSYDDGLAIWSALGRYVTDIFDVPTVCITGSLGKSTTSLLTRAIFEKEGKTFSTPGNLNEIGEISIHLLEEFNEDYKYIIQETGASRPALVENAARALRPDIFCITNIRAHQLAGYGGSIENLIYDKTSLDRYGRNDETIGVINGDDEVLMNHDFQHRTVTCGVKNRDCDYVAKNIRQNGLRLELEIWNEGKGYPVSVGLLGEYNAYNILFAFAIAKESGIAPGRIVDSLNGFVQKKRLRQFTQKVAGRTLIVDAFNVSTDSVLGGCKVLNDMKVDDSKVKKVAILGTENRLGENAFANNYKMGTDLAKYDKIDRLIFYGASPESSADLAEVLGYTYAAFLGARRCTDRAEYMWEPDACIDMLIKETKPGDLIYFKGIAHKSLWAVIDKAFGTNYTYETEGLYYSGEITVGDFVATGQNQLDEYVISAYEGDGEEIIIPDVILQYPVHSIAGGLFKDMAIGSLDLGCSVMYIGDECFKGCSGITEITFPYSCRHIGKGAFSSCKDLKRLTMSSLLTIEEDAFSDCKDLEEVVFLNDCYTVDKGVFEGCPNLTVYGPEGSNIEKYAKDNGIPFRDKDEPEVPKEKEPKVKPHRFIKKK